MYKFIFFTAIVIAAACSFFWIKFYSQKTVSDTLATTTSAMSYAGEYVVEFNSEVVQAITISQERNLLTFSGEATFSRHDQDGHLLYVNVGELFGTTTIAGNKAQYINKEFQFNNEQPCIVDFTFNLDETLDVVTSNGSISSCGWGFNVDFQGHYRKLMRETLVQYNQDY